MTTTRRARHVGPLTSGAVAILCLVAPSLRGQTPADVLRFGMTAGVIEAASASDAKAASLLWAQGIAEALGLYRGAEASVYPTIEEASRALASGSADVLAISSLEYLRAERQLKCQPSMVYEVTGEVTQEYVLLARGAPGDMVAAAGRSIVVYAPNLETSLAQVWGDTHLKDAGMPAGMRTFSSVRYVDKKGHAAMAVFFNQADYGIEARTAFKTAVDLNPQLGRDLRIVAQSPPLLPGLVCLSDRMGPDLRQKYVDRATHLHEQVRYRQAFIVLRVTRLAEWHPRFLDSARALLAKQRALSARR